MSFQDEIDRIVKNADSKVADDKHGIALIIHTLSLLKAMNFRDYALITVLINADEEVSYQIVGEDESDVQLGRISVFSPLARAMIGKKKGDVIEFKSPKGEKEYEVKNIFIAVFTVRKKDDFVY